MVTISAEVLMYVEIDMICIFTALYVLFNSYHNVERRKSMQFFRWVLVFIVLFVVSDLVWELMEKGYLPCTPLAAQIVNCLYFLLTISITLTWLYYTECELDSGIVGDNFLMALCSIPYVIFAVMLIINFNTGILFFFDDNLVFHRGPLNILAFLIPLLYMIIACVHASIKANRKKYFANRKAYVNLANFCMITIIACILQVFLPGTPLPAIGITIAVLLSYMNSQERLISLDPLTKLNNRFHMENYLSHKIEHVSDNKELYILMMDLDKFKDINDTYGHISGDAALKYFGTVLKKTAAVYDCFVCRYGGDEFIVIYEAADVSDVEKLCEFIRKQVADINHKHGEDYVMGVSIGVAKYDEQTKYIPDIIAEADKALYEEKEQKNLNFKRKTMLTL